MVGECFKIWVCYVPIILVGVNWISRMGGWWLSVVWGQLWLQRMGITKLSLIPATQEAAAERRWDWSLPGDRCRASSRYSVRSCLRNKEGWGLCPSPQVQHSVTRGNKIQNQNQNQNQADLYLPVLQLLILGWVYHCPKFVFCYLWVLTWKTFSQTTAFICVPGVDTKHISTINNKSKALLCPLLPNTPGHRIQAGNLIHKTFLIQLAWSANAKSNTAWTERL